LQILCLNFVEEFTSEKKQIIRVLLRYC